MTNEEAIATLKYQHDYGRMEQEVHDALDMAIKALEQPEPCEDTISRQAAIYIASGYCHPANIASELAKLPSIQPEQRWIPVSERLPEEYGEYLVTYKSEGEQIFMDIIEYETSFEYDYEKNGFKGVWLFDGNRQDVNSEVIAWMPLPEPYQGESEDKK